MSISVVGRIKEKRMNEELFKNYIISYFHTDIKENLVYDKDVFFYKCNKFSFSIIWDNDRKYPANIWDSDILNDEYEYSQIIMFDLCKEIDYESAYKCILDFFIFLHEKILCDILVTSDVFNDMCYMNNHKFLWSGQWLKRWEK